MKLVKISRGKTEVVLTGDRKKLLAKLKLLRSSTRNGISNRTSRKSKVEYRLLEDDE